eukprot:1158570-Pelagomonas_calceolata.AAC.2
MLRINSTKQLRAHPCRKASTPVIRQDYSAARPPHLQNDRSENSSTVQHAQNPSNKTAQDLSLPQGLSACQIAGCRQHRNICCFGFDSIHLVLKSALGSLLWHLSSVFLQKFLKQ